jgi:hypothetical protein
MRPGSKDLKGFPEPASDDQELKSLVGSLSSDCCPCLLSRNWPAQPCRIETQGGPSHLFALRHGRCDALRLLPLLLWWSRHRALTSCNSTKSPLNLPVGFARVQPCLHCCSSTYLGMPAHRYEPCLFNIYVAACRQPAPAAGPRHAAGVWRGAGRHRLCSQACRQQHAGSSGKQHLHDVRWLSRTEQAVDDTLV